MQAEVEGFSLKPKRARWLIRRPHCTRSAHPRLREGFSCMIHGAMAGNLTVRVPRLPTPWREAIQRGAMGLVVAIAAPAPSALGDVIWLKNGKQIVAKVTRMDGVRAYYERDGSKSSVLLSEVD